MGEGFHAHVRSVEHDVLDGTPMEGGGGCQHLSGTLHRWARLERERFRVRLKDAGHASHVGDPDC